MKADVDGDVGRFIFFDLFLKLCDQKGVLVSVLIRHSTFHYKTGAA